MTDEEKNDVWSKFCIGLGAILLGAAMLAYCIVVLGFVAMKCWSWFVMTTFDARPISLMQAAGLVVLARVLMPPSGCEGKKQNILTTMIAPWACC